MIHFLTSNAKKAIDFKSFGFSVKEFHTEIPEVQSNDVETVALYKARDTLFNNIVVEDTSLNIDGAPFPGTDIKHVFEEIMHDDSYHGRRASWKICLCMKKDDYFYLSVGETVGELKYPMVDGYHFEKIFSIDANGKRKHFAQLTEQERLEFGPRYIALKKMAEAIHSNDFSNLKKVHINDISNWTGKYQIETTKKKIKP